ncbi:hypothetical protein H9W90_06895 [Polaribacter pectinis]|uniref:Uncharacterized protein n=1 Tax=Polaribacter pectinis TaxID=2738844 RepID=A0A7G9LDY0_9FLAO|nr:hypothetical protein [Polaribacter pectinis]QNM86829.1 hypothetical protein H9W90_06895 [Polaribacter pectinis]
MKKGVLILLGMFMMVSTVEAKNGNELPNRFWVDYSYNNAVNFVERGVEFYIFTNGEFDFNTHYNDTYYDYNGRRTRNSGIRINRDYRGRITSIGSVFINYDYRGNVSRIGNVFMRYYRGRLTKVGNLQVRYDRGGYPNFYGEVRDNFYYDNGIRINLSIGDVCDYNDAYFSHRDFSRNYSKIREDNNYYYYKAKTNAKIGKRSKILKRRKPKATPIKRNSSTINRGVSTSRNNSYRKSTNVDTKRKVTTSTRNNSSTRKPMSSDSKRKVTSDKRSSNNLSYRKTDKNKITVPKVEKQKENVVRNSRRN